MWNFLGLLGAGLISGGASIYASAKQTGAATNLNKQNQRWQSSEAEIARDFNAEEAQKARDWQADLDNTKYQRAVRDLRAAGINPLLATGISPSVPSGASAMGSSPSMPSSFAPDYSGIDKAGSALSSALRSITFKEAEKASAEADNARKEGDVLDAQRKNIESDTAKKSVDTLKSEADTFKTKVDTYKGVVAPIISSAATAYAGKKAGDAAKALVGAGLTKNSAKDIIKEVAPKAASSAKQSSSLWPVLGGMLGVGLPAGAGGLMFNAEKADYERGKRDKKHAAERARRNDALMNALQ